MEAIIIRLTNLWILFNRNKYLVQWCPYLLTLIHAEEYLQRDFSTRYSSLERGCILPHQQEAIDILSSTVEELNQHLDDVREMTFASAIGWKLRFSVDIHI